MRVPVIALIGLLAAAPAAQAQGWQLDQSADRAFAQVDAGGRRLQLGCFTGADSLQMTLLGGAAPLPAEVQGDTGVMIWIELSDGRTFRLPIDTEYMGGAENALIGSLLVGPDQLSAFAQGATIFVTTTAGTEIFRAGMSGTSSARAAFRSVCGL